MKKLVVMFLLTLVLVISINFVYAQNETNETETCLEIPGSMWCADETPLCPITTAEHVCPAWH